MIARAGEGLYLLDMSGFREKLKLKLVFFREIKNALIFRVKAFF